MNDQTSALNAIDIIESEDGHRAIKITAQDIYGDLRDTSFDIETPIRGSNRERVMTAWKIDRDKALGIWKPTPEEGYEVRESKEFVGSILPKGAKYWCIHKKGGWVISSLAEIGETITTVDVDMVEFYEIPIIKEPQTFADITNDSRVMFSRICIHVANGDYPEIQRRESINPNVWVYKRIGEVLNYLEVESVPLFNLRFAPNGKEEG